MATKILALHFFLTFPPKNNTLMNNLLYYKTRILKIEKYKQVILVSYVSSSNISAISVLFSTASDNSFALDVEMTINFRFI